MSLLKSAKTWILIGILIRLVAMPFTYHPDLRGHYLGAWFMAKKGAFVNMYDYISQLPRDNPYVRMYNDNFFVYAPLTYWTHAAWLTLASPAIDWHLYEQFEIDYDAADRNPNLPWLLFILKAPYLFADIALLIVLRKLLPADKKLLVTALWAVNIPILHSAFLMGQFDIFMALGILVALYFSQKNQNIAACIALGLAAGFKPFPLFLLPFIRGNTVKNILVGLFTYGAIIAPYTLLSPGYRMYALLAQHSSVLWDAKVLVSASQYLGLFFTGVALAAWQKIQSPTRLTQLGWLIIPLCLFYSLTHFHPQWVTWIAPLLVYSWATNIKSRWPILAFLGCWLLITLSFEPSLHTGLFGYPFNFKPILTDTNISLIRSLLAATAVALVTVQAQTTHSTSPKIPQTPSGKPASRLA